jgi:antitoxin ParD1/3/4
VPTVEKISIALPSEMVNWIREAVDSGEYASASEVVRDALRIWKRERNARVLATVKRGLKDAAAAKTVYRGSFAKYAK